MLKLWLKILAYKYRYLPLVWGKVLFALGVYGAIAFQVLSCVHAAHGATVDPWIGKPISAAYAHMPVAQSYPEPMDCGIGVQVIHDVFADQRDGSGVEALRVSGESEEFVVALFSVNVQPGDLATEVMYAGPDWKIVQVWTSNFPDPCDLLKRHLAEEGK